MTTVDLTRESPAHDVLEAPGTPANITAKTHHTRWSSTSFSFTQSTAMRLDDLSAAAATDVVAAARAQLGALGEVSRVLVLDYVGANASTPDPVMAYWCLGAGDELLASLVRVSVTGHESRLCAVHPMTSQDGTVSGTISTQADGEAITGRVHLTLTATRVAVGVQIPVESTPLLTASVTGEIARPTTHRPAGNDVLGRLGSFITLRPSRTPR